MKKFIISVLSVLLALSLTACSDNRTQSSSMAEENNLFGSSGKDEFTKSTDGRDSTIVEKYEVGDIILANGSAVRETDLTAITEGNLPIAVIAGFKEDGTAFGIGVHRSDTPLQWAADNSMGYATGFADTMCTQNPDSNFSGDKDGSDNWDVICTQDSKDTADTATNYPAFHFVNTYAETYNLTGDLASGWYMPSIAELCDIYQNRVAVNASLQHIYSLDNHAAMNGLETNWYWSSSQAGSEDNYAWFVHYFNGYAGECPKNFTNVHALVVRAF